LIYRFQGHFARLVLAILSRAGRLQWRFKRVLWQGMKDYITDIPQAPRMAYKAIDAIQEKALASCKPARALFVRVHSLPAVQQKSSFVKYVP
jgi:hypothetical protein